MLSYLLRRLLFAAFLVFAVSSASLVVTRLAPGDYATGALGIDASQEALAQMRARYGLDRPLAAQYWDWLGRAVRLDFGRSLAYDRPVIDLIPERAANTAVLALSALLLATIVGLPLGILTGTYRGGALPGTVRAVSVLLLSMPPLLTSLLLVFLAARTGWFPIGGMRSIDTASGGGAALDLLRHMVVPVFALAMPLTAMFERLQAQAISEVVGQPYVLATLARGVPRARVAISVAPFASISTPNKPALRKIIFCISSAP